jgi:hypothetical protein
MAVHIIDQSKGIAADFRHRALRHHAEGIFMLVIWTASARYGVGHSVSGALGLVGGAA